MLSLCLNGLKSKTGEINMFGENKKAFTLVELLVVISIIALLLSVLLPALSAARSQTRTVVCKSNIRQLVLANTGYAVENNNYYVPAAIDIDRPDAGLHRWHGTRANQNETFNPLKGPLVKYLADGKVKQCLEKRVFTQTDKWDASFEKGCGGYGYNMDYIGSKLGHAEIHWTMAYKLTAKTTDITRTAQTLMFADCAFLKEGNLIEYSFARPPFPIYNGQPLTFAPYRPSIHFRHRNKAAIAWVDGHVSSEIMTKREDKNLYDAKSASFKLGWFGPLDNSLFDLK